MQVIPLQAIPNQTVTVNIANQVCQIDVYYTFCGTFVDLYVGSALLIGGVIAENLNRIVRSGYLGFIGDLAFVDLNGDADPVYTEFGTRYVLGYFSPSELT